MREDCEINYKDAVFKISTTKQKLKQKEYLHTGEIPVIDQGQDIIGGYTNDKNRVLNCELPVIVFGDHTKNVKLIKFPFAPGADGTKVLEPKAYISPSYLYYVTEVLVFKIKDKGYARHYQYIEKEKFPLVSVPEQKAIVNKLEELFSSLDSGIADLKKAQDQLVIYRQAVLKKAFEGELTNTKINNGDLPINWNWASIFDFLFDNKKGMATGPFGTALKKHEHKQEGVPVLGIENIGEGKFKMPNKIFVTPEKSIELKSFKVLENDIIISRSGTVGEICSIPKQMENSLISTNLIRVRLDLEKVLPKFFVYLFQGGNVREQVKELCKGSTRVFLNQTILKKLKLPLCSIEEQKEVIKEIESRLSVCDKVEKDIADSLEKAQALRQSILKKAFEGKLLSEEEIATCKAHPDYEPASVLLEKIKAEKK